MLRRTHVLATIALSLSMLAATVATAAGQRSFVSGSGADVGTCTLTAPCRSFGYAIAQTNSGGEVIVLDSAGYGSVTITKSVSITAPSGIYAGVTVSSGNGVTINAPGATVVLRGLSINGQGGNRGVFFQAGARLRIENCVVSNMSVAGISHNAASGEMIVLDTVVRDNAGSGIVVVGDIPAAVLDHVRSEHNGGDGLNVAPTGGSIGVLVTVANSLFTRNDGRGIGAGALPGATLTIVVERSVRSYNGQDGVATNSATGATAATLTRNMINDNGGHGIWLQGNTVGTASENALHRNGGNGIRVEGDTFRIFLSANSAVANLTAGGVVCITAGTGEVRSLGNNMGDGSSFTCAYSNAIGF